MNYGYDLALLILKAITKWRQEHLENFDGIVCVALYDARDMDEYSRRNQGDLKYKSKLRVGDTGTIWGVPYRVKNWSAGTFALEHNV